MEQSKSLADQSVNDAQGAAASFEQISSGITTILDSVTVIASAAEEQTQVTETINVNTKQLHELTSDSMDQAKQSKSSSQELKARSMEMQSLLQHFN